MLEIKNLHAKVDEKEILNGVSLTVKDGEVHALLGPNGSGKSTLSYVLAGHPKYTVTSGEIKLNGKDVLKMKPEERALEGMFLAFQYPLELQGVNLFSFLFQMAKTRTKKLSPVQFRKQVEATCKELGFEKQFLDRELNVGFSGGEKKRLEVLQLMLANPTLAILDETDSGTDVDAIKIISSAINAAKNKRKMGILLITHYNKILKYVKPNVVTIMVNGKIVDSGDCDLAEEIESSGYGKYIKEKT